MWCYEDPEVDDLRKVVNSLPGLESYEWCWGHNVWPCMIRFAANKLSNLDPLLMAISDIAPDSSETNKESYWSIEIERPFGTGKYTFRLRGPICGLEEASKRMYMLITAIKRRRRMS
jgi:hypothetical protein